MKLSNVFRFPNGVELNRQRTISFLSLRSLLLRFTRTWQNQLFLRSVVGVSPQALIDRVPGQLIKFTCIMLGTKWKGAARSNISAYTSSVSGRDLVARNPNFEA